MILHSGEEQSLLLNNITNDPDVYKNNKKKSHLLMNYGRESLMMMI